MAKWAEIKCERCAETDALWEGMERALEESDAREAQLNDRITMLEEHLCLTEEKLAKAVEVLEGVMALAEDMEPHALQGNTLVFSLEKARTTLAELKGQGDE